MASTRSVDGIRARVVTSPMKGFSEQIDSMVGLSIE